jgi:hypothetical protein
LEVSRVNELLPWWNETLTVEPASSDDARSKLDNVDTYGAET